MTLILACLSPVIWLYLVFARGGFWRVTLPSASAAPCPPRHVVAVIPARDEAGTIGATVAALLRQDFPGALDIIVVDDRSSDGTAALAAASAEALGAARRVTVLSGADLPPGWTGKLWAVSQGIDRALTTAPDYLLLTDADIRHDPDNLARQVVLAEAHRLDLASQMVLLRCRSLAERAFIPAFVFFFFMLYPPAWIADPGRRMAGAAGGSMLIRPEVLIRAGGIGAIRGALIDDCALAAAIKNTGGRVRLDVTDRAHSLRVYGTPAEIWSMIARTAFTQLRYSPWWLAGAQIGLAVTYMAPPLMVLLGHGPVRLAGLSAWILMVVAYRPTLGLYRLSALRGLALPAVALFYAAATIGSAVNYWRGRGGQWKGRAQAGAKV